VKEPPSLSGGAAESSREPAGMIVTVIAATHVIPLMPYFLSLAAGAMMEISLPGYRYQERELFQTIRVPHGCPE